MEMDYGSFEGIEEVKNMANFLAKFDSIDTTPCKLTKEQEAVMENIQVPIMESGEFSTSVEGGTHNTTANGNKGNVGSTSMGATSICDAWDGPVDMAPMETAKENVSKVTRVFDNENFLDKFKEAFKADQKNMIDMSKNTGTIVSQEPMNNWEFFGYGFSDKADKFGNGGKPAPEKKEVVKDFDEVMKNFRFKKNP